VSIVLSFLQLVIVGGALQDTRAMGVVIRADDIQLRSIEGCGDASEVE
jgi:hypothetical protein